MDNFWLYIIIFGAIISFVQRSSKQNTSKEENEPQMPTEEDIERQLRELLGDNTTRPKQGREHPVAPSVRPIATTATDIEQRSESIYTHPKPSVSKTTIHSTPKVQKTASTCNTKSATTKSQAKVAPQEEPTSNIEAVLEDFTMEKAVIYAEILKPKYEEY